MLKKFAFWFACFGLSFLVSNKFEIEQGKAFLCIDLGVSLLLVLALIVIVLVGGFSSKSAAKAGGFSFLLVFISAGIIAIILFATWVATQLFDVDFYVAYQIMTFGQCLTYNSKKD